MINPFYIPIVNIITENNIEYEVQIETDIYAEIWRLPGTQVLSRELGPAVIRMDGKKFWFYENKIFDCSTQEEFEKMLKLKVFW